MAKSSKADKYYAAWPTAWGPVGGVWGDKGLRRLVPPFYSMADLRQLLAWEHDGAVEDKKPFEWLVELTQAYFNAQSVAFDEIECDLSAGFNGKAAQAARQIPYGKTLSYGQLAKDMGQPEAARAVAAAMSKNKIPLVVPCHRVTYSDGRLGGFSAPGGTEIKKRMLAMEKGSSQSAS